MLLDIQIDTFRSIKASQPAGPAFPGVMALKTNVFSFRVKLLIFSIPTAMKSELRNNGNSHERSCPLNGLHAAVKSQSYGLW